MDEEKIITKIKEWLNEEVFQEGTREQYEEFFNIVLDGNDFEAGYSVGWSDALVSVLDFIEILKQNAAVVQ